MSLTSGEIDTIIRKIESDEIPEGWEKKINMVCRTRMLDNETEEFTLVMLIPGKSIIVSRSLSFSSQRSSHISVMGVDIQGKITLVPQSHRSKLNKDQQYDQLSDAETVEILKLFLESEPSQEDQ
jgi:hypothetical protein